MKTSKYHTIAVGITGGIGSGKTGVCKILASFGVPIVYADHLANKLIDSTPPINDAIKQTFGRDVFLPDGKLNRKKIADLVFHDKNMKQKLNAIVHPRVISYIKREIKESKHLGKYPMIAVEAALIYEAKVDTLFDYIIVVNADEETRIQRIMKRDKCSREYVLSRMNAQMSVERKAARADFVIMNSSNIQSLKKKSMFIYRMLEGLARKDAK